MERKPIFHRKRRRIVRDRAMARASYADFLSDIMAREILDRLDLVTREFSRALVIGSGADILIPALQKRGITCFYADASYRAAAAYKGVQVDEEQLPFADNMVDLVLSVGIFDNIDDVPGLLTLIRRILKADGLYLGSFIGAESFGRLKHALLLAEGDQVSVHCHPQIDIRTMGDLVRRTGFTLPVVDSEGIKLRYKDMDDLVRDLRDAGLSNILNQPSASLDRHIWQKARDIFMADAETDGKVAENIEILYICGWSPHADQPKPLAPGSATASLQEALNRFKPKQ